MGKAILAVIVTLIVGYLGTVVGLELLGNWVEFGLLIAIAVMGAFTSTSMTRSKTTSGLFNWTNRDLLLLRHTNC